MRERGAGRGTMSAERGPALDAPTAALVRVAAAVARGKVPELKARFAAARDARVPGPWIEELLLQSMLVVGYPLALVAFAAWRGVGGPAPAEGDGAEDLAHADWESWAARGAAVCREVYGRAYHKLLVNLRALHPALEDLVLVAAYGKVIVRLCPTSRTTRGLRAQRTRELGAGALRLSGDERRPPPADIIGRQRVRSATSVAANYRSAGRGQSRRDFIAKLGIVEEEAGEHA